MGYARIDGLSFDAAVNEICALAEGPGWSQLVVTPNIQHVVELERNPEFRAAYASACLSLPDGWPVVLAARWSGLPGQSRIAGADLFPAVCRAASERGLTIGLVGGQPAAVHHCARRLKAVFPDLAIVFTHEAPVGFDRSAAGRQEVLDGIALRQPNILFVGLGAPRQELFAHTFRPRANVVLGVGAALDFYAGLRPRAPVVIQRLGLEWLFRLAVEPRRLWRRYAAAAPAFLGVFIRDQWRLRRLR